MGAKVEKIEFIDEGFREILLSGGTKELISSKAAQIASRAGEGFSSEVMVGYNGSRWIAFVHSDDKEAAKEEAENKILSGAVR